MLSLTVILCYIPAEINKLPFYSVNDADWQSSFKFTDQRKLPVKAGKKLRLMNGLAIVALLLVALGMRATIMQITDAA